MASYTNRSQTQWDGRWSYLQQYLIIHTKASYLLIRLIKIFKDAIEQYVTSWWYVATPISWFPVIVNNLIAAPDRPKKQIYLPIHQTSTIGVTSEVTITITIHNKREIKTGRCNWISALSYSRRLSYSCFGIKACRRALLNNAMDVCCLIWGLGFGDDKLIDCHVLPPSQWIVYSFLFGTSHQLYTFQK